MSRASWIILDRGRHISTGCPESEAERAEQVLATYLVQKYVPLRKERDITQIEVADVLSIYLDDRGAAQASETKLAERLSRLNEFWGRKTLAEVTGDSCREYVRLRGHIGGARRDLEDLRAAINHHAKEGLHRGTVRVLLPAKGRPRERWLTRDEAARLIWACWRAREVQTVHRGKQVGQRRPTNKRPLRHVARFILLGLYTGTRASSIAAASPTALPGRSFVDLEGGIFYRLQQGKRSTNKRQPPAPLPPRLLAHLRRWKERQLMGDHFVEWSGKAVRSVKTGFS